MEYLLLVVVATVSYIAGRLSVKKFLPQKSEVLPEVRKETKKSSNSRMEERKEKIIQFIKDTVENQIQLEECSGMLTQKGITRVDIEDLLNVSETTVRRYLNILEEEDTVAQISGSGREARYVLKMH